MSDNIVLSKRKQMIDDAVRKYVPLLLMRWPFEWQREHARAHFVLLVRHRLGHTLPL